MEIDGGMDALPDGVVQHILSQLSNARDVAACAAVARCWRGCVPYLPSLYFPRGAFESAAAVSGGGSSSSAVAAADDAIGRMVAAASRLEELVVYCPFSASLLPRWVSARAATLRVLELRVDSAAAADKAGHLDCIGVAAGLEVLRLWGPNMAPPAWGTMERLRVLEMVGAVLGDAAVNAAVAACPNLIDLALLGCECAGEAAFSLPLLERCRLDFVSAGNCSLRLAAPRVESLEVQGFCWISLQGGDRLKHLTISKNTGSVYHVEMGKLPELDQLSLRGVQWTWGAISSVLQCAGEVKHLVMKVEFCGDFDTLQPFPEIDLANFFNSHPKLCKFEIHGAMFAALCQKNSLKNLDSRFVIPCLEQILVTVRSPLNAEQKLSTLESLVRYSVRLRRMIIRISQMKNCHEASDDFFEEICKFTYKNGDRVCIE
ncbi:F-box protein [Dichanthelium oligosanthes]|uniref:F-box protein n=1 Tax=Dichanthelium oligosanthes TaxID=888268 RepID=A0A1E5VHZ9_9POAL|nr:F-box protein [Dichanthelium oligosanthes]